MRTGRRLGGDDGRWPLVISAFGLLVWLGFLWNFAVELRTLPVVIPPLFAFLLGTGLCLTVMYTGVRFHCTDWVDDRAGQHIVGWAVGGLLVLTLITATTILIRLAEGRSFSEGQLELLVSMSSGLLVGSLFGYLYERTQYDAAHVRRTRDAFAFLNRTLRHEFLNGLNIVQGHATLVRTELDDESLQAQAETIETRSEDPSEMVQDFRLYANTFVGEADIEPVDLSPMLSERVENLRRSFPNAEVTADIPDEAPVMANRAVGNVFENLLQNAVEHNDKATPTVTVRVETTETTVSTHVADNGPGIDEAERERIFDPQERDGQGFGLYLADTLVSRFGGRLTIADNDPEGTVVTVDLPRDDATDS
ncbi:sensor histidine kinase [Haloplanus vescus]|uniref:sensor histidine kinase n=1 Tax=Haloplanus vescus TaxID=555874 RepID=UPI0015A4564C|nr:HAMP domain-containing sensor histidine kinase [Haloplanus vescus]